MAAADFLIDVADALLELIQPLQDALATPDAFGALLLRYGWEPPTALDYLPAVQSVLDLATEIAAVVEQVDALNASPSLSLDDVAAAADATMKILGAIRSLTGSSPPAGIASPLDTAEFWQTFPLELAEGLLADYLEIAQPAIFGPLHLLGIIDKTWTPANGAANRVDYVKTTLNWGDLGTLLTDPGSLAKNVYGWGTPTFDYAALIERLTRALAAWRLRIRIDIPHHPLVKSYYSSVPAGLAELWAPLIQDVNIDGTRVQASLFVLPIPPAPHPSAAAPTGLLLGGIAEGTIGTTFALGNNVSLSVSGSLTLDGTTALELYPDAVSAQLGGVATYDVGLTLAFTPPSKYILIGRPDSHRLETDDATLALELKGTAQDPELALSVGTKKIRLVLHFGDADGFLTKIFGTEPQTFECDGAISWSSKSGLTFSGNAGITLRIPINTIIGVVELDTLLLGAEVGGAGFDFVVALTGGVDIGPVAASVDQIGIKLHLEHTTDPTAQTLLGSLHPSFGFKPPDGIGLLVDAGPVAGGGYLAIDTVHGRYAGILQLTLPVVAITAIGLLDTQLPGGEHGYSFLIIITAKFPPIQLGMGFVLTGLGGLAGINRTLVAQALSDGVHSGSVDHILFPDDPIRDATKIITDLQTIFPPAEGQYTFGPMVELGWGSPDPLIHGEIGIILTLPSPIVIVLLGKLSLALPEPDAAIVEINLDVAGVLDLTAKTLAIDATLRDSRILAWNLYGDMALRLLFGAQPTFVMSIGGFNPHFQPPPNFPSQRRLTLALGTGDNPRFTLDCYVAVTSNTFQTGAEANLNAKFGDFKASGDLGFDALIHFQPFSFLVDLAADVDVSGPLDFSATVHFDGHLTGPDPYHAWGQVVVHCLGTHTIDVDLAFGQNVATPAVTPADPWTLLQTEVASLRAWSSTLPDGADRLVTLVAPPTSSTVVFIDPLGGLTLQQKAVPLDTRIDRVWQAALPQSQQFSLTGMSAGALAIAAGSLTPVTGDFAAAQFEDLTDDEKLSRPSFEPMRAGASFATAAAAFGTTRAFTYQYDTIVVDAPPNAPPAPKYKVPAAIFGAACSRSPSAQGPLASSGLAKFSPPPNQPAAASLASATYAIADGDLHDATALLAALPSIRSKGAMSRALEDHYASAPADRGKYSVVGAWELG